MLKNFFHIWFIWKHGVLYIVYTLHVVWVLLALIAGITHYISVYCLQLACMERVIYRIYLHFTRTCPHHIRSEVFHLLFRDFCLTQIRKSKRREELKWNWKFAMDNWRAQITKADLLWIWYTVNNYRQIVGKK